MNATSSPLLAQTDAFLNRAKASGDAVDAITANEVFELITALSWAVDRFGDDKQAARRRVEIAAAGIFT
jgi:hypothetical protein